MRPGKEGWKKSYLLSSASISHHLPAFLSHCPSSLHCCHFFSPSFLLTFLFISLSFPPLVSSVSPAPPSPSSPPPPGVNSLERQCWPAALLPATTPLNWQDAAQISPLPQQQTRATEEGAGMDCVCLCVFIREEPDSCQSAERFLYTEMIQRHKEVKSFIYVKWTKTEQRWVLKRESSGQWRGDIER